MVMFTEKAECSFLAERVQTNFLNRVSMFFAQFIHLMNKHNIIKVIFKLLRLMNADFQDYPKMFFNHLK